MPNLIAIKEIKSSPRSGGSNDQNVRTATRTFLTQWDSPLVGRAEVLAAAGLPQDFWPYVTEFESDASLLVRSRDAKQTEDLYWWEVAVNYSSQTTDPTRTQIENPTLRPPDISWSGESVEIALVKDYDFTADEPNAGSPILNSANEAFDPPPTTTEELLILNYSRNVISIDPVARVGQKNKTNSLTWFGFDPNVAKLADWNANLQFENNVSFWRETFVIKIAKRDYFWWFNPLDQGFFRIVGGERQLILDSAGRALQAPTLLDGTGGELPVGDDPVFLSFVILGSFDFNTLNLF